MVTVSIVSSCNLLDCQIKKSRAVCLMVHKFCSSSKMNSSPGLCQTLRRMLGYYTKILQKLMESYKVLGCNMSIKLYYLHCHFVSFPGNLGAVSGEQGEQFHHDLKVIEERYQGRWHAHIIAIAGASNALVIKLNTPERAMNVNFYLNYLHIIIITVATSFVKHNSVC